MRTLSYLFLLTKKEEGNEMSHKCEIRMRKIKVLKDKTNIKERFRLPIGRLEINVEDAIKMLKNDMRRQAINLCSWDAKKEIRKVRNELIRLNRERVYRILKIISDDPEIEMCIDCSGLGIIYYCDDQSDDIIQDCVCDSCGGLGYFSWIDKILKKKIYVYNYDETIIMTHRVFLCSEEDPKWNLSGYTHAVRTEFGPPLLRDMVRMKIEEYGIDRFPDDLSWRYEAYYFP